MGIVVNRQYGFWFWFWSGEVECRCHLNIYDEHDEKKIILPFGMYAYTSEFELPTNRANMRVLRVFQSNTHETSF